MNPIKATNSLDTALFIYGAAVSLFLTANAVRGLTFYSDLLILTLFLPVTAYFALEIIKLAYRRFHSFLNPGYFSSPPTTTYYFSVRTFLDQDNKLFLTSLFLLTIAFCLAMLRLSLIIWNQP
ncbi:MAG TPA: hypothetical protein VI791_01145 [Patescibacteria group bacterium]|nr:hypothetical protein [Patescibacteria group bacterium]